MTPGKGKKIRVNVRHAVPSSIPGGMPKVVTPRWVIGRLEKIAGTQKTGLRGNKLRESMIIEMRGIIIDSLLLPKKSNKRAKMLLAKKMRILNTVEGLSHATLKVSDGLAVLGDARNQLVHNKNLLMPGASHERIAALVKEFEIEIAWLERAQEEGKRQVVMKAAKQAEGLVMEALKFNDTLIRKALGPELGRARALESRVGTTYINREFPRIN